MQNFRLKTVKGDITSMECDVIVNAANPSLMGGGGVDGAIHRAAGPELLAACEKLGRCQPGQAKITPGFNLKAKHIIHAVGPVWNNGNQNEQSKLSSAYKEALNLADKAGAESIAFPNISTGIYRFPKRLAAQIAMETILTNIGKTNIKDVYFVCFEDENYNIYSMLTKASFAS